MNRRGDHYTASNPTIFVLHRTRRERKYDSTSLPHWNLFFVFEVQIESKVASTMNLETWGHKHYPSYTNEDVKIKFSSERYFLFHSFSLFPKNQPILYMKVWSQLGTMIYLVIQKQFVAVDCGSWVPHVKLE